MWNNNGFANNGMFPNFNHTNNQEEFPPSPFATNSSPANGYFPQQMHPNMMQFENATGAQFNDFQPEPGLYNQDAFMQNQQVLNADAQVRFVELDHYHHSRIRRSQYNLLPPSATFEVPSLIPFSP